MIHQVEKDSVAGKNEANTIAGWREADFPLFQ